MGTGTGNGYPVNLYPTTASSSEDRHILNCVRCGQRVAVSRCQLGQLERSSLPLLCVECARGNRHPDPEQAKRIEQAIAGGSIKGTFKGLFQGMDFATDPQPEPMKINGVKVCIFLERPGGTPWTPTEEEGELIGEVEYYCEDGFSGASGCYVLFEFEELPTQEQVDKCITQLAAIRDGSRAGK